MLASLWRFFSFTRRTQPPLPLADAGQEEQEDEEIVDRETDDEEREEEGEALRRGPSDAKAAVERMVERAKSRLGIIVRRQRDGSFARKRKMSISCLRNMALISTKHLYIAHDLMSRREERQALSHLDQTSPLFFEISFEVAFNKSVCYERLGCRNKALDQAVKCMLIDECAISGLIRVARLLHRRQRFFEAEYCLLQATLHAPPGDMLALYQLRSALKENVCMAVLASGYESSVAMTSSLLFRRLSRVSKELTSGEAFRQKYLWSSCDVMEPAFAVGKQGKQEEYDGKTGCQRMTGD